MSEKPSISDLPTGAPVPSTGATPPSKPIPKLPKLPIGALLAATPSNADAFLAHLYRCMQTPSGIDTVLLLVCYSSRLSANILESASRSALQRSARNLIALAFSLPQNTTILLSAKPPSPGAAIAIQLAARLKALSALLSEGRTFMRLWGLLGMYFWAKRLTFSSAESEVDKKSSSSGEALDKTIAWTQLVSTVAFQALENGAYLSSKGVLGWSPATQGKAILWSTRFWALYVGTELGRLVVENLRKKQGGDVNSVEHKKWMEDWRSKFTRNAAWAPLTVHWSGNGFLSDTTVSALATVPGVIQMRELWKETAKA